MKPSRLTLTDNFAEYGIVTYAGDDPRRRSVAVAVLEHPGPALTPPEPSLRKGGPLSHPSAETASWVP